MRSSYQQADLGGHNPIMEQGCAPQTQPQSDWADYPAENPNRLITSPTITFHAFPCGGVLLLLPTLVI